jgi:glycosyltransferase involved in cell wall biosynthesis
VTAPPDKHADAGGSRRALYLTWHIHAARSDGIAAWLGCESHIAYARRLSATLLTPVRWAVQGWTSWNILAREKPDVVFVQNPPIFAAMTAFVYCWRNHANYVLDSHPGSFGEKGDVVGMLALPVHRWLAKRATLNLVSSAPFLERLKSWGARAFCLPDPPPAHVAEVAGDMCPPPEVFSVAVVNMFAPDEPTELILRAAELLPEMQFSVTGNVAKARKRSIVHHPPNVRFTGFLRGSAFLEELARSHAVLTFTTNANSVMRGAYDGIYIGRPVVCSDWPAMRRILGERSGTFFSNDPLSLADALRECRQRYEALTKGAIALRERWFEEFLAKLREVCGYVDLPYSDVGPGPAADTWDGAE